MSTVLITGASSGIGLATAIAAARRGDRVFAALRESSSDVALKAAAEQLPIERVTIDVTSDQSVEAGVSRVLAEAGHIDVLVNNAGISVSAAVEDAPMSEAKRIFEVNYFGAVRMIKAVLPAMRERRSGRIINVSSISGSVPVAILGHYAASKAALGSVSETLAQEVAPLGIQVALIEPGVTMTPMFERRSGLRPIDPNSPYLPLISRLYGYFGRALKQPLQPDEVAEVILREAATETPGFRHLIGRDALAIHRARTRSTDEEWIETGNHDDDEFAAFIAKRASAE